MPVPGIKVTDIDIRIGKIIQMMRARYGLSQKDLAERIGVTFQQVQKYECGHNRISATQLYKVARVFELPVGALYDESDRAYVHDKQMTDIITRIYKMSPEDKKLIHQIINKMT